MEVRSDPIQGHTDCRAFPFSHYGAQMQQQVLDVRPAQVGRPRTPFHGLERSFVPAQFEMIALFAIKFKVIRKMLTAWGGPGCQFEALSCPKKQAEMRCRLTQAEEGYSLL
jgi:hypothetical protein